MKTFALTLIAAAAASVVSAQDVQNVCPGAEKSYHVEYPTTGSDYVWSVSPDGAGTVTTYSGQPWKVSVKWLADGTLSVYEQNADGCVGEPAMLDVKMVSGFSAWFDNAQVCNGDELNIVFSEDTAYPVSVEFTVDGNDRLSEDITQSPFAVPTGGSNYKIISVKDADGCPYEPQEGNTAVIMPALNKLTIKKAE